MFTPESRSKPQRPLFGILRCTAGSGRISEGPPGFRLRGLSYWSAAPQLHARSEHVSVADGRGTAPAATGQQLCDRQPHGAHAQQALFAAVKRPSRALAPQVHHVLIRSCVIFVMFAHMILHQSVWDSRMQRMHTHHSECTSTCFPVSVDVRHLCIHLCIRFDILKTPPATRAWKHIIPRRIAMNRAHRASSPCVCNTEAGTQVAHARSHRHRQTHEATHLARSLGLHHMPYNSGGSCRRQQERCTADCRPEC